MSFFGLPTKKEMPVVSDLDAMIADPVPFRFGGKVHKIKPISVMEFYKYTNALSELMKLKERNDVTATEMLDGYFSLFNSVCDTITHKDIESMSAAQIAALFKLTVDSITGASQVSPVDEKKKIRV
jgi:hypothetical protein